MKLLICSKILILCWVVSVVNFFKIDSIFKNDKRTLYFLYFLLFVQPLQRIMQKSTNTNAIMRKYREVI